MSSFAYAASSSSLMNILGSSPTPAGYSAGGSTLPAVGGAVGGAAGTSWTSGEALMMGGSIMSVFGAVNSAIGSFYAADSQKTQLKMQAQNQRFQAQMSAINARSADSDTNRKHVEIHGIKHHANSPNIVCATSRHFITSGCRTV